MDKAKEAFSDFIISYYYSILDTEERALKEISNGKVTLKEIHIIVAVFRAKEKGENNFSKIAGMLNVTLGTLTAAFIKLERKGYLTKVRDQIDRRVYYIIPTELAEQIYQGHKAWHRKLVDGVVNSIPEKDMESFYTAVKNLSKFFNINRK